MNLIGSCCDVKSKGKGSEGSCAWEIYSNSSQQPHPVRAKRDRRSRKWHSPSVGEAVMPGDGTTGGRGRFGTLGYGKSAAGTNEIPWGACQSHCTVQGAAERRGGIGLEGQLARQETPRTEHRPLYGNE
jgi:hypothetical protein